MFFGGLFRPSPRPQLRRSVVQIAAAAGTITGDSSKALPLAGSATGTLAIAGDSSKALPLGGNATGTVAIAGTSSAVLPLGGSATGGLQVTGASSAALPLGSAATGALLIQGASSKPLPLGGTATGGAALTGDSTKALPLAGSATGALGLQGASTATLPLAGTATGVLAISGDSSQRLPLSATETGALQITGDSNQRLPLGGSATAGELPAVDAIRFSDVDDRPVLEFAAIAAGPVFSIHVEGGSMPWHPDNSNRLAFTLRSNAGRGAKVTGATVTALVTIGATPVANMVNPMELEEVRPGFYEGFASENATIAAGQSLTALVVADADGYHGEGTLTIPVTAQVLVEA